MLKATGVESDIQVGSTGQFDVLIDGTVVASRGKGFLTRLLGGGWPDHEDVIEIVKERQKRAS